MGKKHHKAVRQTAGELCVLKMTKMIFSTSIYHDRYLTLPSGAPSVSPAYRRLIVVTLAVTTNDSGLL